MQETSFKFDCGESYLAFEFNYAPLVLKYNVSSKGIYVWYFDSERRFSFNGEKLMDMRSLRTLKGEEARTEFLSTISAKQHLMLEGIEEVENYFSVDLSMLSDLIEKIAKEIRVDPRAFLDLNVSRVMIEVNKEFKKDAPGFQTVRKFRVEFETKDTEFVTIIWDDGRREVSTSDGDENAEFKFESLNFVVTTYKRLHSSLVRNLRG